MSTANNIKVTNISATINSKRFPTKNTLKISTFDYPNRPKVKYIDFMFSHRSEEYIHEFYFYLGLPARRGARKKRKNARFDDLLSLKISEKEKSLTIKTEHYATNQKTGKIDFFHKTWKIIFKSEKDFKKTKELLLPYFKEKNGILVPAKETHQ